MQNLKYRVLFPALFFFVSFCGFTALNASLDVWDGADYSKNSSSQKEAASDLMNYVSLNGNECILDVGCGDGKITAAIAAKVPEGSVTGIDLSSSMIEFAQKTYPQKEHPNLHFVLKDAEEIDNQIEFDIIFSFTALQWIQNHDAFLKIAHESLKSSGILAMTMPLGPPKALEQAINEAISSPQWSPYFQQFNSGWNFVEVSYYHELLCANDFDIIRYEVVPQKDVFVSRENFEIFFSQFFPYLRALPQDLKKPFLTQVVARFLELETPFPNGEVHWKFLRLEVVSKKKQIRRKKNHDLDIFSYNFGFVMGSYYESHSSRSFSCNSCCDRS